VTERLVKMCLEDTIKVALDYEQAPVEKQAEIPVGGYSLIYNGQRTPAQFNLALSFGDKGMKNIKC